MSRPGEEWGREGKGGSESFYRWRTVPHMHRLELELGRARVTMGTAGRTWNGGFRCGDVRRREGWRRTKGNWTCPRSRRRPRGCPIPRRLFQPDRRVRLRGRSKSSLRRRVHADRSRASWTLFTVYTKRAGTLQKSLSPAQNIAVSQRDVAQTGRASFATRSS